MRVNDKLKRNQKIMVNSKRDTILTPESLDFIHRQRLEICAEFPMGSMFPQCINKSLKF